MGFIVDLPTLRTRHQRLQSAGPVHRQPSIDTPVADPQLAAPLDVASGDVHDDGGMTASTRSSRLTRPATLFKPSCQSSAQRTALLAEEVGCLILGDLWPVARAYGGSPSRSTGDRGYLTSRYLGSTAYLDWGRNRPWSRTSPPTWGGPATRLRENGQLRYLHCLRAEDKLATFPHVKWHEWAFRLNRKVCAETVCKVQHI